MKIVQLALVAAWLGSCAQPSQMPHITGLEGTPLPAFNLLLTDSSTWINSASIPEGKPMVLFYFNPGCPYCKLQTKEIIDEMHHFKDVQFYLVTDYPFREMKRYAALFDLEKYPNITTALDTGHIVRDYFRATFVPFTAIYTKQKKLDRAYMGRVFSKELILAVEEQRKMATRGS